MHEIRTKTEKLELAARWALGLLLLAAAVLKGHELASGPLVETGLWGNRLVMAVGVEVEGMLGLWLLSGIRPRLAGLTACVCFTLFGVYALGKALTGAATCGCFGRMPVNPWITFTLDVIAAPASAWVAWTARTARRRPAHVPVLRLAGVGICVLGLGGTSFFKMVVNPSAERPDRRLVALDPSGWVGRPWAVGEKIDLWPQLAHGRWAVLLYSWSCGHCHGTVADYGRLAGDWAAKGEARRVALIDTSGDETPEGRQVMASMQESPALRGRLHGPPEWFIASPTLVVLENGRVTAVAEGEGDCAWDEGKFRKE